MSPLPSPIHFGPSGRELFGFLHAPASPRRGVGVVVCAPLGHEATYVYRAVRHVSERLAAAGFAVIRFDYDGTGDSAGSDRDADRVPAWLDSIAHATEALKARAHVDRFAFFGIRLGATLATLAAERRTDVDDLVLFAPAVTGKAYVRELRALGMLGTAKSADEARGHAGQDADLQEAAGFLLTKATVRALGEIDLCKERGPFPRRTLIVPRDDLPMDEQLQVHLRRSGVDVETRALAGYREAMNEPLYAKVPEAVIDGVVDWLCGKHPATDEAAMIEPTVEARDLSQAVVRGGRGGRGDVRETAIFFGGDRPTFGVVAEPLERGPRSTTATLMLNTATDTRIGPSRMYVDLSREWAALGFTAVRVDLSGIGDTPARDGMRENWAFSPSFVRDVQTILDFLVARGVKRFVLMGLCSGAYLAYHTAVADPRVAGTLLVNPQSFHYREGDEFVRTTEFKSMGFYRSALFRGETWKKALRGEVHLAGIARTVAHKLVARGRARLSRLATKTIGERSPSVDVAEYLEEMCDRGVDVHFVFGDTDPGLDYLRAHLREREESLRARKNFHVSIIDDVDHTFTRSWARRVLFDRLSAHVVERFG